jgi:hypothetical protein
MLIEKLKEQMRRLEVLKVEMLATPDQQILLTDIRMFARWRPATEAHMKFHVAFCRAARRVLFRLCQGS